jgi:uncharacterized protein (DUF697 family)
MVSEHPQEPFKPLDENVAAVELRSLEAKAIIHRNVLWAMGAGAIPVPILDMVLSMTVQLKMLKQLSSLYGVPFRERLARKLLSSLLVSVGGIGIGVSLGASLAKLIPGAGLAFVTAPILTGAFTQAAGNVFFMHFETGGTYLDFEPKTIRDHFRREYEAAKESLARMRAPNSPNSPNPPNPIMPPVVHSAKPA